MENTKFDSKKYNATYYAKNKEEIIKKLMTPINCPLCNRTVCSQRLRGHQLTKLCSNNRNSENKNEIKELRDLVNKLLIQNNTITS
jgi:hypothetical protein